LSYITHLITTKLIDNKVIDKELYNIYKYGLEVFLSAIVSIIIIFFISIILNCIYSSLIFLAVFIPTRNYCGGYHANTYFKCSLTIITIYLSILFLSNVTIVSSIFIIILYSFCFFVFLKFSPVENKAKGITNNDKLKFKKTSLILLILSFIICLSLYYINMVVQAHIILFTDISISILIIIGKKKGERDEIYHQNNS